MSNPANDNRPRIDFVTIRVDPAREKNDTYFGACPHCRMLDGYLNDGREHYAYCAIHQTKWNFGSNLFSNWRDETPEERTKQRYLLSTLMTVEPVFPEHPSDLFPAPTLAPSGHRGWDDDSPF